MDGADNPDDRVDKELDPTVPDEQDLNLELWLS